MKKFFAIFLSVVMILPVLLLPAAAFDTSDVYCLEPYSPISVYSSGTELEGNDMLYTYCFFPDSPLPCGDYYIEFERDGIVYKSKSFYLEPPSLLNQTNQKQVLFEDEISISCGRSHTAKIGYDFLDTNFEETILYFAFYHEDGYSCGVPIDSFNPETVYLISYTPSSSGSSLDFLSDSVLGNVFDEIIDLLPIVIPVFAGFLGIRKAITFVRSKISGA